jgi:hypothetical protein
LKKARTTRKSYPNNLARLGRGFGSMRPFEALHNACPVVKASYFWMIVSDQLKEIIGPEVHYQWFQRVKPVVIVENTLLLETPTHLNAQWIHCHYQDLIDTLLSVHDRSISALFMSQKDRMGQSHLNTPLRK